MRKAMNLNFASSLTDLCEINSSFDMGVLRIAYTGENRNKSAISKETFERCIPSMYNCPIVCNYDRESDSLGGHDIEIVASDDGGLKIVNVTSPVGCIPESAKFRWDTVTEDDGTEHEYLFTEALLWKRQEAYQKIKRDGVTSHSMEIVVKDGESKDGIYQIYDFEFTAFALIGVEPCYESSALETFSKDEFKRELSEMMADLKETFSLLNARNSGDDNNQDISKKGGVETLDKTIQVVKFDDGGVVDNPGENAGDNPTNTPVDNPTDTPVDNPTDTPGNDPTNTPGNDPTNTPGNDTGDDTGDDSDEDLDVSPEARRKLNRPEFELNRNVEELLHTAVYELEQIEADWGPVPRYWMIDFDADKHEVYCDDNVDRILVGFSYSVNGDAISIDADTKVRKKFAIVDFVDGEAPSPFTVFRTELETEKDEKFAITAELNTAKASIGEMTTELDELRSYKREVETAKAEAERSEVFSMFDDLVGIEEFDALKENAADYDVDALEEKCFAIRGRHNSVAKFSLADKAPRLRITKSDADKDDEDLPYGGIVEKYCKN